MFNDYYSLQFNPFDKQQVADKDRFISHDFKEMLSRLDYLKDTRGIGVFTAKPGDGKTFCLRCFARELNPNLFHVEYISLSTVSVADFYKQLCHMLGLNDRGGKTVMFKSIQDEIYSLYKDKRRPLILAIDEAQYLSTGILNDIKMIMNCGFDSINCFTLILCGEPYLNDTLRKPVHEALRQRITVHYNFEGLTDKEASEYVIHKLVSAGSSKAVIDDAALSAVAGHSHGSPRIIDNIMTDAIAIGAQTDKKCIDAEVILAAVNNQNL